MNMPSEQDVETVRQRCQVIARECGLDVDCALTNVATDGAFRVIIEHGTDVLGFEVLERLSVALGSTDMNLSCDQGTSSDHSHNPYIIVKWPSFDEAQLRLVVQKVFPQQSKTSCSSD